MAGVAEEGKRSALKEVPVNVEVLNNSWMPEMSGVLREFSQEHHKSVKDCDY